MIRLAVMAMSALAIGSDKPVTTSASMPYFRVAHSSTWITCSGRTIVNGAEVKCMICGGQPVRARVLNGDVEAYCKEHDCDRSIRTTAGK